jgi:SAM-dependent methyltransferase
MEEYTKETKTCLDERFRACDETGIYVAHQPIYGFRKGHSERGLIVRYLRTYQIIRSLSCLNFESLLDVGCAEGFQGYLIAKIFGVEVRGCDLSEEACRRAREIFDLEADPTDIHTLPYGDGQFDVVVCSETLEHVIDSRKALYELLRVASKAVVITVPHEPIRKIKENIDRKIPHGHINSFKPGSFDFLREEGYRVIGRRFISRLLRIPQALLEAMPAEGDNERYPAWLVTGYNLYSSLSDRIIPDALRKRVVALMMPADETLCRFLPCYEGLVFVILKDKACASTERRRHFSADQILDTCVPYYYLGARP